MNLYKIGFILIVFGIVLLFIASIIPFIIYMLSPPSPPSSAGVGVGGCIVILFIPICFSLGQQAVVIPLLAISIILLVIVMIFGYMIYRETRKHIQTSL